MPFYLKDPPNKRGDCLISMHFLYHGRILKLSTGLTIMPSDWDDKRQRAKRTFRFAPHYNAVLDKWETAIQDTYYSMYLNGIPTVAELKEAFFRTIRPGEPETVYGYAARFAESRKNSHSKSSYMIYRRCAELIGEFDRRASFDSIDMDWLERFKKWLYKKGYEQNTANKHFKTLKTVLNDATDRGLNTNMKYKTQKVSIGRKETTKIFLDEGELLKWYRTDMPNKDKELARDLFILASYTGVRFQDIWAINRNSFKVIGLRPHFVFNAQKTGDEQMIPAHPFVIEVMEKYGWKLPRISNQKYNDHLKEIGRMAGIVAPVMVTTYPGGKRVDTKYEKCELISSHTARRNLVCNMLLAGVPTETIKKISGHKTQDAFEAYVRLTPSDHLRIAFKSDFFRAKAL